MQAKIKEPGGLHGTSSFSICDNTLYYYHYQERQLETIDTD